jgi:hypothetical protein
MVSLRRQLPARVAPQPERLFQVGRLQLQAPRQVGGDGDVLRHQRDLEARGEGAGQHLLRDLALGGPVAAGGGIDGVEHRLRLEAEALREQ